VEKDAVVEIAADFDHDGFGRDAVEAIAGGGDGLLEEDVVERLGAAVFEADVDLGLSGGSVFGTFVGALFAVEDVGAGDLLFAAAHEGELDLVLNVFDVDGARVAGAAAECLHDGLREGFDGLADAAGGGGFGAFDGDEGFGDGDGDLAGVEGRETAVAADDLKGLRGGGVAGEGGGRDGRSGVKAGGGCGHGDTPWPAKRCARETVLSECEEAITDEEPLPPRPPSEASANVFVAGLRTCRLPTGSSFPVGEDQCCGGAFVPAYRCGAVPDSHRIPIFTPWLHGDHECKTHSSLRLTKAQALYLAECVEMYIRRSGHKEY